MWRFIKLLITYLPLIIATIKTVESITSADTEGEDKKTLVLALILDALKAFGVAVSVELEEFLGKVIDVVVRALNLLGIFSHNNGSEPAPEEEGVASAVVVKEVATVIREAGGPNDARLDELEALLTRGQE